MSERTPLPPQPDGHQRAAFWAAELLGLIGQAASDYAHGLKRPAGMDEAAHRAWMVARLAKDLAGRVSLADIRRKLDSLGQDGRHKP